MCTMGFQTNNRDEKAVDLVTGDKNEDEEKDKKPRLEIDPRTLLYLNEKFKSL